MDGFAWKRGAVGVLSAALLGLSAPVAGAERPAAVEPEALASLVKMTDYLAGLERFSLRAHGAFEVVLTSGQKIEYGHDSTLTLERPNKLRATRRGEAGDQVLFYDGESLSFYSQEQGYYAVEKLAGSIEAMMDFARDELDVVAPAADLLYRDAYESLTRDMSSGFVVSKSAWLDEQSCTHLAFRKPGVDVQIWIRNGADPVPIKYVLTTTDVTASPQFSVTLSDWNPAPRTDAATFRFAPPAGARRIDFVHASAAPTQP